MFRDSDKLISLEGISMSSLVLTLLSMGRYRVDSFSGTMAVNVLWNSICSRIGIFWKISAEPQLSFQDRRGRFVMAK